MQTCLQLLATVALAATVQAQVLTAHPPPANNGLTGTGMGILFDLTGGPADVTVNATQVAISPTAVGALFQFEVLTFPGSVLNTGAPVGTGPGSSAQGWQSLGVVTATQGAATSNGVCDLVSIPDVFVPAGQTVGVCFRALAGGGFRYRSGTAGGPYSVFSTPDLALTTGDARSQLFSPTGSSFWPREFVGDLHYVLGGTAPPPPPARTIRAAFTDCLPGTWIDISATGTPLDLPTLGTATITSPIGNALIAAGDLEVGSNGGIRAFGFPGGSLSNTVSALPGFSFLSGQALMAFWQNLNSANGTAGNTYWQVVGNTLVIQYHDVALGAAPTTSTVRFQIQVHGSGPAFAQFLYQDIEQDGVFGGSQASIGYQNGFGPALNDVQYSFRAHNAVRNGTVLSLIDRASTQVFFRDDVAGTFTDISATGTALDLADDGEADIPTTVGNALLAAGVARVGSNGGVRFGGVGNELGFSNAALPSSSAFGFSAQSLLPFWDDFNTVGGTIGNIFWQELGDVLIVQWQDAGFFNNATDRATFQVKVFGSGPYPAQFIYQSVDSPRAGNGNSATIGYQAGGVAGTTAQYSFNTASVSNGTVLTLCYTEAEIGTPYCTPIANSTGAPARLFGTGSTSLAANDLVLHVEDLPLNSFGFFNRGTATANTPAAGGGLGTLCVGGTVTRGVGGSIVSSGTAGAVSLGADLANLAGGTPAAGATLWLQYWYRDTVGGTPTSNLSNALQLRVSP